MKNKRNVWNHAMIINLNIIIYVMMIVQMVHIEYFKTEIYARLKFQTIIISIIMIIYIKNVIIIAKNVLNWEMKLLIIVMNA